MKYTCQLGNQIHSIDLEKTNGGFHAVWNGQEFDIVVVKTNGGELSFRIGDQPVTAFCANDGTQRWVFVDGKTFALKPTADGGRRSSRGSSEHHHAGESISAAPMPGLVRAVQVAEGDVIAKGQTLFILEAMKMEIRVQAPRAGKLAHLNVRAGQSVEREQVLAEIE